jgi:hypothetical protein
VLISDIEEITRINDSILEPLANLSRIADQSTVVRRMAVTHLYDALEEQLKKFVSCRETSLAITNLQQSRLWRVEAMRLWDEAEAPKD